ncbi:hypothetical protein [Methanobrevibacter sp. DSM 116169]|uniref:hypothetical protein n=1 Tax=Methanobrevibacter sp. DSM 116169 TaxID=3242727 RepID=UPI0038FCA410
MKIKNIVVLLMLLFLSISAVSANELADENNDLIIDDNNYDVMADEIDSYTKLNESIATNDVVDLNGNTVLYGENDTNFINGININKTVTIQNGIIDGNNTAAFFNVENGNLILINITLQNGFSGINNALISAVDSNITFDATDFTDNYYEDMALLYTSNSTVEMNDVKFIDNLANESATIIYDMDSTYIIDNTNFIGNVAHTVIVSHGSLFTIKSSSFYNNDAIYNIISNSDGNYTISDVVFIENFVEGNIIINYMGNMDITNCTLENNFGNSTHLEFGSIIVNTWGNLNILDSDFINNSAEFSTIISNNEGNLSVLDSNFDNNVANVVVYNNLGNLTIIDSEFDNNKNRSKLAYTIASYSPGNNSLNLTNLLINSDIGPALYIAGNIYLENNMINVNDCPAIIIIRVGENNFVSSQTYLTILDNSTIYAKIGDIINLTAYLTDDNGNIIVFSDNEMNFNNFTFTIDGNNFSTNKTSIEGVYYYEYNVTDLGIFVVSGDNEYCNNLTVYNGVLDVGNPNFSVIIDSPVCSDENSTVVIELDVNATGNVTVVVNGTTYLVNMSGGIGVVNLPNLAPGSYNVTVSYVGDGDFYPVTYNDTLVVNDVLRSVLSVDDLVMYYRNGSQLIAYLTNLKGEPLVGMNVTFFINGRNYTKTTNATGHASMNINLDPGSYYVFTVFDGSANYSNASCDSYIEVESTIEGENVTKMYKNDTQYYATLYYGNGSVLANTNVTMNINGVLYTRETNENGTVRLNINLDPDEYVITVYNPVNNQSFSNLVTVLSSIEGENVTKMYKNDTQYYATLYNADGSVLANTNVSMNINGVMYIRETNENGTVKLNINLDPDEYVITVYNPVNNQSFSNIIKVLPILVGENLNKTFGTPDQYEVAAFDEVGNPAIGANVTININGVMYYRISGDDGVAKLNINLNVGSYIATATWKGYSTSNIVNVVE